MIRVVAALLLGLSVWLAMGVLAVADTGARVRVGLLPPIWLLGLLAIAAVSLVAWRPVRLAAVGCAGAAAALCLLPWLPATLPSALLLWTGPLALLPWIGAGVGWVSTQAGVLRSIAALCSPRIAPRVAFAAALALYAGGYALVSDLHPGGDEPHYLIISQSLLADGDLKIQNNHDRGEYESFFAGYLPPDFLRRGVDGEIYSIHAPGLPVLVLPAYALLGARGVVAFLVLVAAAGAALLWRTAYDLTRDAGAAWMAWAGAALSVPFVFHSFAIFPDGPASVLVLVGVRALAIAAAEEHPRSRDWVLAGAALACLPWMHTRYAILAGVLGVAICLTLVRRTPRGLRACALFLALPFVSAAGWFWYFWSIYGTPSPSAPYGGYTQSAIANLLPGVTGLLVDSQFGLLATAPVLAWSLVGLAKGAFGRGVEAARRAGRLTSFALAALCLVYIAAAGSYRMWWGGASAPARFVVPLVLPLGVALAIAWTTARSYAARALMVGAVTVGLWLTIVLLLVDGGRLAYNDRDGLALWAAWASPAVDLARALPGVHRGPVAIALAQAGAWLSAGVLAWLALRAYERRGAPDPARLASAAVLVMGMAAVAGAAVSWTVGAVPPGRPGSQARLLASIDTWGRSRGLVIDGSAGVIPRVSLHRAGSLAGRLSIPGMSGRGRVDLPALPPGRYRLEARARTAIPAPLTVRIGPAHLPAAVLDLSSPGPDGGGAALDLTFPVAVPNWAVSQPGGRVVPPVDLRIRPLTLLRPPVGMTAPARQVVAYGPWLAFFLDDGAYVEPDGFWVRPGHEVALVVGQPDASHGLRLSIRNVPLVNRVTVTSGKWHDELRLEPGAEREVVLPPPGPLRATVLRLRADRGGRPSQFDPGNHDQRELGAWIAFR